MSYYLPGEIVKIFGIPHVVIQSNETILATDKVLGPSGFWCEATKFAGRKPDGKNITHLTFARKQ